MGIVGAVIMPHNIYLHSALVLVSMMSSWPKQETESAHIVQMDNKNMKQAKSAKEIQRAKSQTPRTSLQAGVGLGALEEKSS